MKRDTARDVALAIALAGAATAAALAQGSADARRDTRAEVASEARSGPSASPARSGPFIVEGDRVAGQRVASGGTAAGPGAACFNCHGIRGGGDGTGAFPRLAGQSAWYLYKQLNDYANGTRPNETMTAIAVRLTERERQDVAVWYASQDAPFRTPAGLDPELVQRGGRIAAVGSASLGVQACAGCHGPAGVGMPPDVPFLAGQNPGFIELQLRLWHEGRRRNDALGVMADVARRLPPDERRAVAAYFGSLQAPAP
jgi:cytochrome c553